MELLREFYLVINSISTNTDLRFAIGCKNHALRVVDGDDELNANIVSEFRKRFEHVRGDIGEIDIVGTSLKTIIPKGKEVLWYRLRHVPGESFDATARRLRLNVLETATIAKIFSGDGCNEQQLALVQTILDKRDTAMLEYKRFVEGDGFVFMTEWEFLDLLDGPVVNDEVV